MQQMIARWTILFKALSLGDNVLQLHPPPAQRKSSRSRNAAPERKSRHRRFKKNVAVLQTTYLRNADPESHLSYKTHLVCKCPCLARQGITELPLRKSGRALIKHSQNTHKAFNHIEPTLCFILAPGSLGEW